MASTDSRPVPIKNTAYRAVFPILDNDGDLVTAAAGLDSEISKDQGTFADCTNEATEIATSSGMYYLDLTSTEMNADCVAIIVKTTTTNAKTTPIVLYPQESGDIKVDLQSISGSAVSTSTAQLGVNVVQAGATAWGSGAITAGSIATDAITSAKIAADAIGASELAADAVSEIADQVWDEVQSGHVTAGTFGRFLDAQVANVETDTQDIQSRLPAALVGGKMDSDAVAISGSTVAADNVEANIGNLDASIQTVDTNVDTLLTRITSTLFSGITSLAEWLGLIAGKQTGNATARTEIRATGAGSGTYDETTDSLEATQDEIGALNNPTSAAIADAVWDEVQSGHTTAGTFGKYLDVEVSSVGGGSLTEAGIADAVWDEAISGHLSAGSTGEALNAAGGSGDPWITTLPGSYTSGQAGYIVGNNLDAAVSSRSTVTTAQVNTEVDTALADYDGPTYTEVLNLFRVALRSDAATATDLAAVLTAINADLASGAGDYSNTTEALEAIRDRGDAAWITATGFSTLDAAGVRSAVGLASANLDTQLDALPTAAENADAVLDEALAGHTTAGTAGKAISDIDTNVAAILADTGTDGVVISAATLNSIADAVLKRDWTAISGEASRSALNALRNIRNGFGISGTTLTVFKEDDSTAAFTRTLTTSASAEPVIGVGA